MTERCSILQVEDEEADITVLRFAFKRAGITAPLHAVTDGQMAIDYLSGEGEFIDRNKYPLPCIVLLDIKLPKRAGLEVLTWIRQHPTLKRLVVIVLSSSAEPRDLQRAYDLGANSFIEKPAGLEPTCAVIQAFKSWWLDLNCAAAIIRD